MQFLSCRFLQNGAFVINAPFDDGKVKLQMCCEACAIPLTLFGDTPEETLAKYLFMRTMVAGKIMQKNSPCLKCINCVESDWDFSPVIKSVNLSLYPSPCQSKCIYCNINEKWRFKWSKEWDSNDNIRNGYDKVFSTLEYAIKNGFIHPEANWTVACGEITIHPYKQRIYDFVRGKKVSFLTNAFVFDREIAETLKTNSESSIFMSIDAGLAQTWNAVKGVDNFAQVTENLAKYRSYCANGSQIRLKYIVLPGINDTYEDYISLIQIMKALDTPELTISRNTITTYTLTDQERSELIGAAAYLVALCRLNDIKATLTQYSEKEQEEVEKAVVEILENDL